MKKAFFDGWDHLFTLVLVNVVFVLLVLLGFLILPALSGLPAMLGDGIVLLLGLIVAVCFSASVFALNKVADYASVGFRDYLGAFREAVAPGIQYGLVIEALAVALGVGLPYYLSRGSLLGALAAGLLFWGGLVVILSLQWYLPLRARLGGGFKKNARKSLLLFFDNPGFSLFLFFYNLVGLVLSCVVAFLLPGPAGVALALDDALRLRLYKYDWLETQGGGKRHAIPWDELLVEERELVGKRSFKGMIFPWKE